MLDTQTASASTESASTDWIALFTQSALRERPLSASTLEAYTLDLAMLTRWAEGRERHLPELTTTDLTGYVVERAAQGTQLSTLARHLSTFRRFYSFLNRRGAIGANPAAAVLVPQARRPESGLVRDDVVRNLLRAPRGPFPSMAAAYRAQRDHAIIRVLYGTGLGISDVRLLRWQQIDEHWHVIRVPLRNGVFRSFVLDGALLAVLKALHQAAATHGFNPVNSPYCFPTASGLPMTRQALCHLVRKWASDCGQDQVVTPSALRHAGRASVRPRTDTVPAGRHHAK